MKNNVEKRIFDRIIEEIKKDEIQKIVVGAVVCLKENSPLLVRRASDDFMGGLVEIPSGTVDAGETIEEALFREVKEEVGLKINSIDSFIGTFDYLSGSGKKTRQINFKVTTEENNPILSEEHDAFYIFPINSKEYNELNISNSTRKIISNAFSESIVKKLQRDFSR